MSARGRQDVYREMVRAMGDGAVINRRALRGVVTRTLQAARTESRRLAVVVLGLDRFNRINDGLGHEAGDEILCIVRDRLRTGLHAEDTVLRYGADEFLLLLERADAGILHAEVRRIQNAVSAPMRIAGETVQVTCSAGASVYPGDGDSAESLLRSAETAMRYVKTHGRNSFRFHTREAANSRRNRLRLEERLQRALDQGSFFLEYQPQVGTRRGELAGVEALIRLRDDARGVIMPNDFIPLAEETGLIVPIGDWALRAACRQTRSWHDAGGEKVSISVNLSGAQFRQKDLAARVAGILRETGLEAQYLNLEITESVAMEDVPAAIAAMRELRSMGVSLSLDDFGTGFSSLGNLRKFPLDVLKIDRSFVRDIAHDPECAAIAASIIGLARDLRLKIVAEGVETVEQASMLCWHRCDALQGYYFSAPLSAEQISALIAA